MLDDTTLKVYPIRHFAVLALFLANISSVMLNLSYSTIPDLLMNANVLNTSQDMINMFYALFTLSYVLSGFIASWILQSNGLRIGVYFMQSKK